MRKQRTNVERGLLTEVLSVLLVLIMLPFRKKKVTAATEQWEKVQTLMTKNDSSAWVTAILKADTILDDSLKALVAGETLGERLKQARSRMSPDAYDAAWKAHIVRNKLAHEHLDISKGEATQAISQFRTALNNLGAL